jgi:hypothetical protein
VVRRRRTDRKPEDYSPLSRDFVIQGGFIAAKPGHDVIKRCIMQAVKNIHHRMSNNPWLVTGPGVLGEQIRGYYQEDSQNLSVLELDYYKRFVKLYGGTLEYKKGGRHWSKVMQRESIFYESIAESHITKARSKGLWLYDRLFRRHSAPR